MCESSESKASFFLSPHPFLLPVIIGEGCAWSSTVMTIGVRYELCGPRRVGDWATTPTDRPGGRPRREASSPESGRRLRFAGRIPNSRSALLFCSAGAACMDRGRGRGRGGRREGERSTVWLYSTARAVLCSACVHGGTACVLRHVRTKPVAPVEQGVHVAAIRVRVRTMFNVGMLLNFLWTGPLRVLYVIVDT